MSISIYDLLKRDIKKMIGGIGKYERGNIHGLVMQEVEKYLIEFALEESGFNLFRTAQVLGISRNTLYKKIDNFGILLKQKSKKNFSSYL